LHLESVSISYGYEVVKGKFVDYKRLFVLCTKNVAFILPIAEKCGIMNYDDMEGRAL
jgi:hypothetical protein